MVAVSRAAEGMVPCGVRGTGARPVGVGIGTYVGNDEIGAGRIKVWPLIQSTSCSNSTVFRPLRTSAEFGMGSDNEQLPIDEEDVKQRDFVGISLVHRGDRKRLEYLLKNAIGLSLNAGAAYLDKLIEAETQRLPNFTDVLAGLAKKYNWSEKTQTNVALGTRGDQTVAGLVSGITFAAQDIENQDARLDMETLGGAILVNSDSLFGRAAQLAHAYVLPD